MTTAIDRSDPQGEGPSPRSLGQEISNAQDPQVVRIEEDDEDVGGDADAGDVVNFPKSLLKRIVKEQLMNSGEAAIRDNGSIDCSRVQISKSCLEAFDEAARLFIHYITWSAGEELRKGRTKRQTMSVEDVLAGIEEAEYGELLDHLRNYASELQAGKKKKKKEQEPGAL